MEDNAWIDFLDGEEPRPLPDGRYEAIVQSRGTLKSEKEPKPVRRESGKVGGPWFWDWGSDDPDERLPFDHSRVRILRVRKMGNLYPSRRRVDE